MGSQRRPHERRSATLAGKGEFLCACKSAHVPRDCPPVIARAVAVGHSPREAKIPSQNSLACLLMNSLWPGCIPQRPVLMDRAAVDRPRSQWHASTPDSVKKLRACILCRLIKTYDQVRWPIGCLWEAGARAEVCEPGNTLDITTKLRLHAGRAPTLWFTHACLPAGSPTFVYLMHICLRVLMVSSVCSLCERCLHSFARRAATTAMVAVLETWTSLQRKRQQQSSLGAYT